MFCYFRLETLGVYGSSICNSNIKIIPEYFAVSVGVQTLQEWSELGYYGSYIGVISSS